MPPQEATESNYVREDCACGYISMIRQEAESLAFARFVDGHAAEVPWLFWKRRQIGLQFI
jgi:hypothetical protein